MNTVVVILEYGLFEFLFQDIFTLFSLQWYVKGSIYQALHVLQQNAYVMLTLTLTLNQFF